MKISDLLTSWNPSKYNLVREFSWKRLILTVLVASGASVALFLLLLMPAFFQSEEVFRELSKTTNITFDAAIEQTQPTLISQNPDILITTQSEGDGFIVITPDGFSIKYFLFFGERSYPWLIFSSIDSFPAQNIIVPLLIFTLPSALIWGTLIIIVNLLFFSLLFTSCAALILHLRNYNFLYSELWKVSLYAALPSIMLFAALPILRFGLPIAVIVGFLFALWLVFSLLGVAQLSEKAEKKGPVHIPSKNKTKK